MRQSDQVKTSFYRKPTFNGVFTHYESYLDQSYKKLLILTFLSCILGLQTIAFVSLKTKRNLKKNSYPSGIIELSIRAFLKLC